MDSLDKIKSLYKSGRFQCDHFFYSKLYQIVNELNLYEYTSAIQKNKDIVQNIAELTKKHLATLEEQDNQQKALKIIHQINKNVQNLDTKFTSNLFAQIDEMGGKSFQQRLIAYVKAQPYKKMYLQIFDRIINAVHDPKIRLDDMLVVGLFMSKNHDKVPNFITIYSNILQEGVNQLRKFRQNYDFIKQNPQIQEEGKVVSYLKGSPIILQCLFKFNQIYKLLSGDNKFGLKLNALKKDVFPPNYIQRGQSLKTNSIQELKRFLIKGQAIPSLCSFCLCGTQDHHQCKITIKLLYKQKQQ